MKKVWDILFVPVLLLAALIVLFLGLFRYYRAAYPLGYSQEVELRAEENGLDPALVYAVIRSESGFACDAQSSVGARGLMQLTPDTFYWVRYRLGEEGSAKTDLLFEPEENIRYGCANLRLLVQEFGGEATALAAYHAGWGNVSKWLATEKYSTDGETLDVIPFGDTDRYVSKVLATRDLYHRLYPELRRQNS